MQAEPDPVRGTGGTGGVVGKGCGGVEDGGVNLVVAQWQERECGCCPAVREMVVGCV